MPAHNVRVVQRSLIEGACSEGCAVPAVRAQNVRVVQRNLVYVVGLALELCYEDLLKGPEYFGQFGKVVKVRRPALTNLRSPAAHAPHRAGGRDTLGLT